MPKRRQQAKLEAFKAKRNAGGNQLAGLGGLGAGGFGGASMTQSNNIGGVQSGLSCHQSKAKGSRR